MKLYIPSFVKTAASKRRSFRSILFGALSVDNFLHFAQKTIRACMEYVRGWHLTIITSGLYYAEQTMTRFGL